jgi:hypothetical protein
LVPDLKTIRAIIASQPEGVPLDHWIFEQIGRAEAIARKRAEIGRAIACLESDTRQRKDALDLELTALQKECPHYAPRPQGDPAGGSDSSQACEVCGKVW